MAGIHSMSIYTSNDNPWCSKCIYSAKIKKCRWFEEGAFVCIIKEIPTKLKCREFQRK